MSLTLSFHGAAECVTGFCARLTGEDFDILIDCGMFQGSKTLKALNYKPFPFDIEHIDAVLLTHAHIDHSGMLPKLMKAGYKGPIHATTQTRDLCAVMLADSGQIQESEVFHLNRRNQQRGLDLVEPIYTARDAERAMQLFETVKFDQIFEVAPGVRARFWHAGHMLGAASVEVIIGSGDTAEHILFSGDLGAGGQEYLPEPTGPTNIRHLVLESTYGDREREPSNTTKRRRLLAEELRLAHAAGGPLLMPTFAVGRAQELLLDLLAVMQSGEAPACEIFLDSPLAIEATQVFLEHGWNRDTQYNPFEAITDASNIRNLVKPRESDRLEKLRGWHIVMAGSGMCDAGRIRRHLKRLLSNNDVTVLITGYQAMGTLGRLLVEGKKLVSIQGEEIRVRAAIRVLDVYSAHADATGLVHWAQDRMPISGKIFLAHGEPEGLKGLATRLADAGFAKENIIIPTLDESFKLAGPKAEAVPGAAPRLPAGVAAMMDWHNARADLMARIRTRLEDAPDETARQGLLKALEAALAESGAG